jgi:hypothetical protein
MTSVGAAPFNGHTLTCNHDPVSADQRGVNTYRDKIAVGRLPRKLMFHRLLQALERCAWPVALLALMAPVAQFACAAEPRLPNHEQALELIHRAQLASPYRLSEKVRAGRIRYTLSMDDDADWAWPQTAEQKVTRKDDRYLVTVCSDCGIEAPPDAATLAHYLEANAWVDSDSPAVLAFARANAFGIHVHGTRVARQMKMLVKAVQDHMSGGIDFRAYDSASQALRSRSGDCTEYAVLLAAAARARGIPTRLVYGLAYASRFTGESHVFSPHVWVQAWNGKRWTSYDAGLGQFDAGHIAVFIGDGSISPLRRVTEALQRLNLVDAVGVSIAEPGSASVVSAPH